MKNVKTVGASVVALMLASSGAWAGEWTGCHVGASGGALAVNNTVTFDHWADVSGIGATGGSIGVTGGCDAQLSQLFVVGVMADWNKFISSPDSSINIIGGPTLASLSYDTQWSVGGRAGILLSPNILAYGLVAYTGMNTSDLTIGGSSFTVPNFTGYAVGGGLETALTKSLHLGLEYRYNKYGTQETQVYGHDIDFDPTVQTVRASLTWQFTDLFGGGQQETYGSAPPPLK